MKKVELKFNDYVNENGECFTVIYNCYNKELAIETNGGPDCTEWCDIENMLIDTPWEDEEDRDFEEWSELTSDKYRKMSSDGLKEIISNWKWKVSCDAEKICMISYEDEENWEEGEFPVYWNEGTKEIISVLNGNAKIEKHAGNLEEVKEIIKSLYPEQEIIFE